MFTKRIAVSKSDLNCDLGQVFDFPGIINAKTLGFFIFFYFALQRQKCVLALELQLAEHFI